MKNPRFISENGTALSLSNLFYGNNCSVVAITDAIEDATNAVELCDNLNELNLSEKFMLDRVTESYVRIKSEDSFGNVHYLSADLDKEFKHNLDEYYDPFADNYQIPSEEMTAELMAEATEFIKACPYEEGGYLLMYCPSEIGYEESFWCITSWTE